MQLADMNDRDRAANLAARFLPKTHDASTGEPCTHPCVEVGGAVVFVYVRDGALVVSVDLDTADDEVFGIYGPDRCVPVRLNVGDTTVFEAGA